MNNLSEKPLWPTILGIGAAIGVSYLFLSEEKNKAKRNYKVRRTRNEILPGSRDLEENLLGVKITDEKVSSPIFSANIDSTKARSSGIISGSNSRTSKMTFSSTRPSKGEEERNKYPIHYYSLNKKQQWKFRKKFNLSHQSVI